MTYSLTCFVRIFCISLFPRVRVLDILRTMLSLKQPERSQIFVNLKDNYCQIVNIEVPCFYVYVHVFQ